MTSEEPLAASLARVQSAWRLGDAEMAALSHVPLETYLEWKRRTDEPDEATIPPGMQTAAHIVSLHRKLTRRFPKVEEQVDWLTTSNRDFDGNKPLDVALSSPDNLLWVNYYLDSSRSRDGGTSR